MTWRAATAAALLLLGATTAAEAQRRGGPGGGPGGWDSCRMWEAAQPGGRGDGGYGRYGGGGGGGYGGERGDARQAFGGPGGGRPYGGGEGGYGGGGWRRGQVLPPAYRGAYVPDPGRYHLRAPPPGYGWVGDGRDAYLTQRSTGMVLDRVPRAYEPAPAWRRGGGGGGRGRRPR